MADKDWQDRNVLELLREGLSRGTRDIRRKLEVDVEVGIILEL